MHQLSGKNLVHDLVPLSMHFHSIYNAVFNFVLEIKEIKNLMQSIRIRNALKKSKSVQEKQ